MRAARSAHQRGAACLLAASLLALSVLAAGLGACASAAPGPEAPALEVANRTPRTLVVSVRGRVEGTVAPGTRLRVHNLERGPAALAAWYEGGTAAAGWKAEVDLEGGVHAWEIVPDGVAPLPEPPALTTLTVENTTAMGVVVKVDGRRLGRVIAGDKRLFRDVPAGAHTALALTDTDEVLARAPLTLAAGGDNTWAVVAAGAHLTVVNDGDEAVALFIDGRERATIEAGVTWSSDDIRPGRRQLHTIGLTTHRTRDLAPELTLEAPFSWRLSAGSARLLVRNRTGETLDVTLPDKPAVRVADGAEVELDSVPTGSVTVTATEAESGARHELLLALGEGQRYTWTPRPLKPTLRVVNRTPKALVLYVKGVVRGEVAAGEAALVRRLPAPPFDVELYDREATLRLVKHFDTDASLPATWIASAETGSLHVENRRPERLEVNVDGRRVGETAANGELTFTGILTGERLVEARGERSGAVLRAYVTVDTGLAATVTFANPNATLVIDNALAEALTVQGPLAQERRQVPPGEAASFRIPAEQATYSVLAEDGATYARKVTPGPGETVTWAVRATDTSLIVQNELAEDIAVTVDDRAVGSVAPGKVAAFPGVATGRRALEAVGLTTGTIISTIQLAREDAPLNWTVARRPGRALVDNASAERVAVSIDGEPYASIEARATKLFPNLSEGAHTIVAEGDESGVQHRYDVEIHGGQDVLVRVEPPMGVLLLDNQSGEAVRVSIDGARRARLPAGSGAVPVAVPAGHRLVQIERLGDHTVTGFELDLAAEGTVALTIPRSDVRLVIANQLASKRTVALGARTLGVVEPGGSLTVEGLPAGWAELTARDADDTITHAERRQLESGETATWVLVAPEPPEPATPPATPPQ